MIMEGEGKKKTNVPANISDGKKRGKGRRRQWAQGNNGRGYIPSRPVR